MKSRETMHNQKITYTTAKSKAKFTEQEPLYRLREGTIARSFQDAILASMDIPDPLIARYIVTVIGAVIGGQRIRLANHPRFDLKYDLRAHSAYSLVLQSGVGKSNALNIIAKTLQNIRYPGKILTAYPPSPSALDDILFTPTGKPDPQFFGRVFVSNDEAARQKESGRGNQYNSQVQSLFLMLQASGGLQRTYSRTLKATASMHKQAREVWDRKKNDSTYSPSAVTSDCSSTSSFLLATKGSDGIDGSLSRQMIFGHNLTFGAHSHVSQDTLEQIYPVLIDLVKFLEHASTIEKPYVVSMDHDAALTLDEYRLVIHEARIKYSEEKDYEMGAMNARTLACVIGDMVSLAVYDRDTTITEEQVRSSMSMVDNSQTYIMWLFNESVVNVVSVTREKLIHYIKNQRAVGLSRKEAVKIKAWRSRDKRVYANLDDLMSELVSSGEIFTHEKTDNKGRWPGYVIFYSTQVYSDDAAQEKERNKKAQDTEQTEYIASEDDYSNLSLDEANKKARAAIEEDETNKQFDEQMKAYRENERDE